MFFDEIAQNLGVSGVVPRNYSILNYAGRGVYIQGSIDIKACSTVKILLNLAQTPYLITGKNLQIRKLTKDTLYISGKIIGININIDNA